MPQGAEDLKAFLAKEITADYLKNKAESTIDYTYAWFSGKTETVPCISLVDLRGKIETFAQEEGLPLADEIENNFSEPIEIIRPDQNAQKIRMGFQLFQKSPPILGAVGGVLLLAIFLLAQGWKSKLRRVSLAFFVPGFLGLLTIIPIIFLFTLINSAVSDGLKEPGWKELVESVNVLLSSISSDVIERMLMIYGSVLVLAIILFAAAIFVGNKVKEQPKVSSVNQRGEIPPAPNPAA